MIDMRKAGDTIKKHDKRSESYSIAMVAACPFPANHGSAASIREMSDTLSDMGHNVHIVTYPFGQEDIRVRRAKVHRTATLSAGDERQGWSVIREIFSRFSTTAIALPSHSKREH